jgi:hypothetical protein
MPTYHVRHPRRRQPVLLFVHPSTADALSELPKRSRSLWFEDRIIRGLYRYPLSKRLPPLSPACRRSPAKEYAALARQRRTDDRLRQAIARSNGIAPAPALTPYDRDWWLLPPPAPVAPAAPAKRGRGRPTKRPGVALVRFEMSLSPPVYVRFREMAELNSIGYGELFERLCRIGYDDAPDAEPSSEEIPG